MIMNVLWKRLGDNGANWRHVYKVMIWFFKEMLIIHMLVGEYIVSIISS
jgi:hypothetical protein